MKIGELIGIARDLKKLTLRDLERETGVSNALISQIENGHVRDPGFFTVLKIANGLGLSLERLSSVDPPSVKCQFEEALADEISPHGKASSDTADRSVSPQAALQTTGRDTRLHNDCDGGFCCACQADEEDEKNA